MLVVHRIRVRPLLGEAWAEPGHPHLARLYGVLVDAQGVPAPVMELAAGGDIGSKLHTLVPPSATVRWARGACCMQAVQGAQGSPPLRQLAHAQHM